MKLEATEDLGKAEENNSTKKKVTEGEEGPGTIKD